ncbi:hypothetical protein [Enterobacter hormaechei]|uniref:hypothetical protein n=1 Tax=Enterobacter TaxID=547 RepID=UPI00079AD396|nr:hypothetical protein [Enterobacter hormaechei]MBU5622560.1 hypothetical protein [Enterobacteriaceae bacterium S5_ASV_15]MBJ6411584.1 hypothetical protein [Enterobacter hormaechei]MBK4442497.1 hypothetical protein [Enterobacter hormaechei]MBK4620407.1 hypothetical protein [Enterobacter hormaechei]MCU2621548.1 hypothetical protein [Enterobacter hormaechei subsp. hoffmannii]
MKINLSSIFRKKNALQKIYPRSSFFPLIELKCSYPFFRSLERNNIYAYSSRIMVKPEGIKKIESTVKALFCKEITQEKEFISFKGKALHYFKFEEFDQTVIDIITNNVDFIRKILCEKLEPPAPDVVFPDCDFESLGSLQGNIEFWWDVYWSPFWNALSEEDKMIYLHQNNISNGLRDFLMLHN